MAAAALVLGILATICPFLYSYSANLIVAAIPLGLVALLAAILARRSALRRSQPAALATVAVVTGVLPLVISTGILVFYSHLTSDDKPFVPRDGAQAQKLEQDRSRNSKDFDELVDKALKPPQPLQQDKK